MVFAKTSKAAARLSESFRERLVGKDYLCVVNGDLKGDWLFLLLGSNRDYRRREHSRISRINANDEGVNLPLTSIRLSNCLANSFPSLPFPPSNRCRAPHSSDGQERGAEDTGAKPINESVSRTAGAA